MEQLRSQYANLLEAKERTERDLDVQRTLVEDLRRELVRRSPSRESPRRKRSMRGEGVMVRYTESPLYPSCPREEETMVPTGTLEAANGESPMEIHEVRAPVVSGSRLLVDEEAKGLSVDTATIRALLDGCEQLTERVKKLEEENSSLRLRVLEIPPGTKGGCGRGTRKKGAIDKGEKREGYVPQPGIPPPL